MCQLNDLLCRLSNEGGSSITQIPVSDDSLVWYDGRNGHQKVAYLDSEGYVQSETLDSLVSMGLTDALVKGKYNQLGVQLVNQNELQKQLDELQRRRDMRLAMDRTGMMWSSDLRYRAATADDFKSLINERYKGNVHQGLVRTALSLGFLPEGVRVRPSFTDQVEVTISAFGMELVMNIATPEALKREMDEKVAIWAANRPVYTQPDWFTEAGFSY